jgi:dephospho-CoA kinase
MIEYQHHATVAISIDGEAYLVTSNCSGNPRYHHIDQPNMLLLGLTGSIATGKSTVSQLLRSPPYSLPIIDADILARQVVEPGTTGYAAIVREFGPTTPDLLLPASDPICKGKEDGPNGKGRPLNRPALGRAIFGEGEEIARRRNILNGIVHPAVRREMWRLIVCFVFWVVMGRF